MLLQYLNILIETIVLFVYSANNPLQKFSLCKLFQGITNNNHEASCEPYAGAMQNFQKVVPYSSRMEQCTQESLHGSPIMCKYELFTNYNCSKALAKSCNSIIDPSYFIISQPNIRSMQQGVVNPYMVIPFMVNHMTYPYMVIPYMVNHMPIYGPGA